MYEDAPRCRSSPPRADTFSVSFPTFHPPFASLRRASSLPVPRPSPRPFARFRVMTYLCDIKMCERDTEALFVRLNTRFFDFLRN